MHGLRGWLKRLKYLDDGDGRPTLELTERNLLALLAKLADPASGRRLISPCGRIQVRAVPNEEHYKDREPGVVYMPTSGEYW